MAYHVFLATPKGMEESDVEKHYAAVVEKFVPALDGIELLVVKAEDDYREHFARCGSWEAWTRDVGQGVDYLFRTPRYNCIVCVQQSIGKATADIVRYALEGNRMVVLANESGGFDRVTRVDEMDSQNYRSGWFLQI